MKQNVKICAIGEQNVSLYLRRTKNLSDEKEGMVEREDRDREKRDKRELS